MANIAKIAQDLVDLCRKRKYAEAVEKYYADDVVTVESAAPPVVLVRGAGFRQPGTRQNGGLRITRSTASG